MFPSPYRETLIQSLSTILKTGINVKSSTLLQAFATFTTIKEENFNLFISSYNTFFNKEPECSYRSKLRISNISNAKFSNLYTETINLFTSLSPSEFFRFIIPDIVSNPIKTTKILHDKFSDNILLFSHHILLINIVIHSNIVINTGKSKNTLDVLYNIYQEKESITEIRLNKSDFTELYIVKIKSIGMCPYDIIDVM